MFLIVKNICSLGLNCEVYWWCGIWSSLFACRYFIIQLHNTTSAGEEGICLVLPMLMGLWYGGSLLAWVLPAPSLHKGRDRLLLDSPHPTAHLCSFDCLPVHCYQCPCHTAMPAATTVTPPLYRVGPYFVLLHFMPMLPSFHLCPVQVLLYATPRTSIHVLLWMSFMKA